jgi:hypothetical protein
MHKLETAYAEMMKALPMLVAGRGPPSFILAGYCSSTACEVSGWTRQRKQKLCLQTVKESLTPEPTRVVDTVPDASLTESPTVR